MFARLAGHERYTDTQSPSNSVRHPSWMEHTGGTLCRAAEKKRKHSGEMEESTLLLNFIHFLVLVIYIFVTIQLFNVCLVLFLTLLYIRTQRC